MLLAWNRLFPIRVRPPGFVKFASVRIGPAVTVAPTVQETCPFWAIVKFVAPAGTVIGRDHRHAGRGVDQLASAVDGEVAVAGVERVGAVRDLEEAVALDRQRPSACSVDWRLPWVMIVSTEPVCMPRPTWIGFEAALRGRRVPVRRAASG